MAEGFNLIPAEEKQKDSEEFLTRGERMRRSFAVNGGKYAFYDGGTALMTYREVAADGGKAMHEAAVQSTKELFRVLKNMDLADPIEDEE